MPTSFVLGPCPAGKLDLLYVGCFETGRGGDALKCSILREYRHFCCAKTSYTEPGTTDSCCQQSLPEPGLLYAVHACWTFCMLAGLCACWLDFVHAGWTLCMLAALLHARRTYCMLAGLTARWLDFVHAGCTFCILQVPGASFRFLSICVNVPCDIWTHTLVWHGTVTSRCGSP